VPHHVFDKETKLHTQNQYSLAKHLGKEAERRNVTTLYSSGKCAFKPHMLKNKISLNSWLRYPDALSYSQRGAWMKHIRHSNSLCARVTGLITNHVPICEYCRHFFPCEENICPRMNACLCGMAQLETRDHVLYYCI